MRVGVWVLGAEDRLGERWPPWFGAFAGWLLERCAPAVSLRHLRRLESALHAGVQRPAALIAAVSDGGDPAAARETPPGCSKRFSSPAAWCSPATSKVGSLRRSGIREVNDAIIDACVDEARPALEAYSQLLRSVAEAQE